MKKTLLTLAAILAIPASLFAEKVPYLGIAMKNVSPELKAQLDIKHGVLVAGVAEGSPAETKLKKHDILTKVEDQKLMNPDQLTELIQTFGKDQTVAVEFVRAGKVETTEVKLSEREPTPKSDNLFTNLLNGTSVGTPSVQIMSLDDTMKLPDGIELPKGFQKQMEKAMKDAQKNGGAGIATDMKVIVNGQEVNIGDADKMAINLDDILKEVGINMNGKNGISVSSSSGTTKGSATATTVWNDNGVTYQITTSNGEKVVKISEGGKTIFEGPANSDEDMEKMPEEHRKKLEEIQGKVKVFTGKKGQKKEKKDE